MAQSVCLGKINYLGFNISAKNIAFFKILVVLHKVKNLMSITFFVQLVSSSSVCISFKLRQACVFICLHFRFQRTLFKKLHRFKKQLKHSEKIARPGC